MGAESQAQFEAMLRGTRCRWPDYIDGAKVEYCRQVQVEHNARPVYGQRRQPIGHSLGEVLVHAVFVGCDDNGCEHTFTMVWSDERPSDWHMVSREIAPIMGNAPPRRRGGLAMPVSAIKREKPEKVDVRAEVATFEAAAAELEAD